MNLRIDGPVDHILDFFEIEPEPEEARGLSKSTPCDNCIPAARFAVSGGFGNFRHRGRYR